MKLTRFLIAPVAVVGLLGLSACKSGDTQTVENDALATAKDSVLAMDRSLAAAQEGGLVVVANPGVPTETKDTVKAALHAAEVVLTNLTEEVRAAKVPTTDEMTAATNIVNGVTTTVSKAQSTTSGSASK